MNNEFGAMAQGSTGSGSRSENARGWIDTIGGAAADIIGSIKGNPTYIVDNSAPSPDRAAAGGSNQGSEFPWVWILVVVVVLVAGFVVLKNRKVLV